MEHKKLIVVEELLNQRAYIPADAAKKIQISPELVEFIDSKLDRPFEKQSSTIYEDVIFYIKRLDESRFLRKNGGVKEATFYQYAHIDKSTWSDLKWNQITPSKKTVLKLALALKLSEEETNALLAKAHQAFDAEEIQDKIILALLDLRNGSYKLDVDGMIEVLAYYQENGPQYFDSIYDTPEMIAQHKTSVRNRKK